MRLRQVVPWLVVIVAILGGSILWNNNHAQPSAPPSGETSPPAPVSSPATPDQPKQTANDLQHTVKDLQSALDRDEGRINDLQQQLSAEQGERKLLSDQVSGLAGRLDGLEKARPETAAPARRRRR